MYLLQWISVTLQNSTVIPFASAARVVQMTPNLQIYEPQNDHSRVHTGTCTILIDLALSMRERVRHGHSTGTGSCKSGKSYAPPHHFLFLREDIAQLLPRFTCEVVEIPKYLPYARVRYSVSFSVFDKGHIFSLPAAILIRYTVLNDF